MIKNNALRRILISTLALFIFIFLYLFPVPNIDKNIETQISYIQAIETPVYLIDNNNYVSRINIINKSTDINSSIEYIIKYLTKNSNESYYLPSGFHSIIPVNTKLLSYNLTNKILKLDFSKEFLNISTEEEIKLIESIVFSLCEFKEIDSIMIFVEGEKLNILPKNNIQLPNTLNKNFGINKVYDITSIKQINHTINYYISKINDYTYYIPISKYENTSKEKIEVIIKNLQTTPYNQTNLISYLKASATLENYQILEESVSISFNNELIADLSSTNIIEEVKYSIFLSIRDTYDIKSVVFDIQNEQKVTVLLD